MNEIEQLERKLAELRGMEALHLRLEAEEKEQKGREYFENCLKGWIDLPSLGEVEGKVAMARSSLEEAVREQNGWNSMHNIVVDAYHIAYGMNGKVGRGAYTNSTAMKSVSRTPRENSAQQRILRLLRVGSQTHAEIAAELGYDIDDPIEKKRIDGILSNLRVRHPIASMRAEGITTYTLQEA